MTREQQFNDERGEGSAGSRREEGFAGPPVPVEPDTGVRSSSPVRGKWMRLEGEGPTSMQVGNRSVALIDILGFKKIVRTSELSGLANKLEHVLVPCVQMAVTHAEKIVTDSVVRVDMTKRKSDYFQFSDTVLLYSLDSSFNSCLSLVVSAWHLVRSLFAIRFPCRGAVVFGPLAVDAEKALFVGQSVIDAYEIAEAQDWGGAVICPCVEAAFPKLRRLAAREGTIPNLLVYPYRAPFKGDAKLPFRRDRQLLCLNWRYNLIVKNGTKSLFRDPENEGERAKIRNTLRFCKLLREQGKVSGNGPNFPAVLTPFHVPAGVPKTGFSYGDEY